MQFGGNAGPIFAWRNTFSGVSSSGMTAISWLYRRNCGFVLAADGRAYARAETAEEQGQEPPDIDNNPKIFKAKFKTRDIAYALTGTVFNLDRTFNLVEETPKILAPLSACENLYEYAAGYGRSVNQMFDEAKRDGRIKIYGENINVPEGPERTVLARIFFAGYFRKRSPSFAIVTLSHENQLLNEPRLIFESPPQRDYLVGAGEIARLIYEGKDHWVNSYAKPANDSLNGLVSLAKGFIRACCDERAVTIDPSCRGIGGKIHVAHISIEHGFEWIEPPQKSP